MTHDQHPTSFITLPPGSTLTEAEAADLKGRAAAGHEAGGYRYANDDAILSVARSVYADHAAIIENNRSRALAVLTVATLAAFNARRPLLWAPAIAAATWALRPRQHQALRQQAVATFASYRSDSDGLYSRLVGAYISPNSKTNLSTLDSLEATAEAQVDDTRIAIYILAATAAVTVIADLRRTTA